MQTAKLRNALDPNTNRHRRRTVHKCALYGIPALSVPNTGAEMQPCRDARGAVDHPRSQDPARLADAGHIDLAPARDGDPTLRSQRHPEAL